MAHAYFPQGLAFDQQDEQTFYQVVQRLKIQDALKPHCFQKELPYFNIPALPKEVQMRELYENACDAQLCKQLLQNIVYLSEGAEYSMLPQNFSPLSVMSFAQIIFYKVLPCPDANCARCPREIATHNQYKDFEYECPFYHHERDRRRLVIPGALNEEFSYKANYFEEGRRKGEKEKYSQNYFESMFHPLYYKMFRCKRDYCEKSAFCPFHHCEEEKNLWDNTFSHYINKDRVSYVKDKPKSPEKKGRVNHRMVSEEETLAAVREMQGNFMDKRAHVRPRKMKNQPFNLFVNNQVYSEDRFSSISSNNSSAQLSNGDQWGWNYEISAYRNDSQDSSFEEKYGYGFYGKLQATTTGY